MALHVRDLGAGPPVVLLHPGPGLDGSVFLPHVNQLVDAGYRALLVDLPGSGRSPGDDFTLEAQAATDIPVLAIVGSEERFGTGAAERIAETAPRGELVVIDGAGHFPFAEAPDRYWPALVDWLRRT